MQEKVKQFCNQHATAIIISVKRLVTTAPFKVYDYLCNYVTVAKDNQCLHFIVIYLQSVNVGGTGRCWTFTGWFRAERSIVINKYTAFNRHIHT